MYYTASVSSYSVGGHPVRRLRESSLNLRTGRTGPPDSLPFLLFSLFFSSLILWFFYIIELYLYVLLSGSPTHLIQIYHTQTKALMLRSPHQTHRHTIV